MRAEMMPKRRRPASPDQLAASPDELWAPAPATQVTPVTWQPNYENEPMRCLKRPIIIIQHRQEDSGQAFTFCDLCAR